MVLPPQSVHGLFHSFTLIVIFTLFTTLLVSNGFANMKYEI